MDKLNEDLDNITSNDKKLINNYNQNIKENLNKAIIEINSLSQSINLYKETIFDYIILSTQKSDLIAKYSKANTGGSFNLPAVFSSSLGSYNLDSMKDDNKEIENINNMLKSIENQKNSSIKFICRSQSDLTKYISNLMTLNNELETYLELLAQNTSWESNIKIKK